MHPTASKLRTKFSGTNLQHAADHNQRVTLHAIRVNSGITRVELAAVTGLTAPAITNITKRLLEDGLIREGGRRRQGRGQPAITLEVRNDTRHAIGLNIDRDYITIVVVDFAGKTLARLSKRIAFALPRDVQALYRAKILGLLDEAGVSPATLVGIGVAMPDDLSGVHLPGRPQDYDAWATCSLPGLLASPVDAPVFVENDATAAAIGEMQLGLGQRYSSFFYMLISSGLGGGLVVDGHYYRGAHGRSGELGFIEIARDGENGAGAQNGADVPRLLQDVVSLTGLAAELASDGLDLSAILNRTVPLDAAQPAIDRWCAKASAQMFRTLEAINCLFDPDRIVIGGRLPSYVVEGFAHRLHKEMVDRGKNFPNICPVDRGMLSEDAPAIGAAILPLSHFLLPASNIV